MSKDSFFVIAIWSSLCVTAIILWILTVNSTEEVWYDYYFSFFQLSASIGAAFFCYRAALVLELGDATRNAWKLLSIGLCCWSVGAIIEGSYPFLYQGGNVPFPWYTDAIFLLTIPFVVAALVTFKKGLNVEVPHWGLIFAVIMFLVAFGLAFQLNAEVFEEPTDLTTIVVTMAYVILDSLLLAMMIAVASTLSGGTISRPWQIGLAGWLLFYLGDISYTFIRNVGRADIGGVWLDLTWPIAFGLIALGATMARAFYQEVE